MALARLWLGLRRGRGGRPPRRVGVVGVARSSSARRSCTWALSKTPTCSSIGRSSSSSTARITSSTRSAPVRTRSGATGSGSASPACSSGSGTSCSGSCVMRGTLLRRAPRRRSRLARRPRRGAARPPRPPPATSRRPLPRRTARARRRSPGPRQPPSDTASVGHLGHRLWRVEPAAGRPTMYVGRSSGPAATSSASPVTPVITSSESTPAAWAPSMSVSSRSPTISGRSPPHRRTVSSSSGRAGLPATTGSTPLNRRSVSTSTPWPGATPNGRRERQVGVARDPPQPVAGSAPRPA